MAKFYKVHRILNNIFKSNKAVLRHPNIIDNYFYIKRLLRMRERELKKFLHARIKEIIASLELRIKLNAKTIVPLDSIRLSYPKKGLGLFLTLESIVSQNMRAEQVIDECYKNINKLNLLLSSIHEVKAQRLLKLFHSYNKTSFEDIYAELYSKAMVS